MSNAAKLFSQCSQSHVHLSRHIRGESQVGRRGNKLALRISRISSTALYLTSLFPLILLSPSLVARVLSFRISKYAFALLTFFSVAGSLSRRQVSFFFDAATENDYIMFIAVDETKTVEHDRESVRTSLTSTAV